MGQAAQLERPANDDAVVWGVESTPRPEEVRPLVILELDPVMKDRVLGALLLIKGARLVAFEEQPR